MFDKVKYLLVSKYNDVMNDDLASSNVFLSGFIGIIITTHTFGSFSN